MRKPLTPAQHPLDPLVSVMAKLRGPGGCPWDREQDHHTLKKYLIEEAYEVLDAIDQGDDRALAEELGDVLLQVVFHSQIASETGRFDIDDVVRGHHRKAHPQAPARLWRRRRRLMPRPSSKIGRSSSRPKRPGRDKGTRRAFLRFWTASPSTFPP